MLTGSSHLCVPACCSSVFCPPGFSTPLLVWSWYLSVPACHISVVCVQPVCGSFPSPPEITWPLSFQAGPGFYYPDSGAGLTFTASLETCPYSWDYCTTPEGHIAAAAGASAGQAAQCVLPSKYGGVPTYDCIGYNLTTFGAAASPFCFTSTTSTGISSFYWV